MCADYAQYPDSSIPPSAINGGTSVDPNLDISLNANMNVAGDASFSYIYVSGKARIDGETELNSTLNVAKATTLSSTLAVTDATTLSSTLAVSGAATLSSTLDVTGDATMAGTLGVDTINEKTRVQVLMMEYY